MISAPSWPRTTTLRRLAQVQSHDGRQQDAIATYEEIATRFRGDPRVAAALFDEARLLERTRAGDAEIRRRLAIIGDEYPTSSWFVPAMLAKIAIEDKAKLKELDPTVGVTVPASLLTRRLLVERAPLHPAAEQALWKLGEMFEGLKDYRQAVGMYVKLGTTFPATRLDAWFRAAELYERKLNADDEARSAYLNVPTTSSRYRDAQARAKKLTRK